MDQVALQNLRDTDHLIGACYVLSLDAAAEPGVGVKLAVKKGVFVLERGFAVEDERRAGFARGAQGGIVAKGIDGEQDIRPRLA